MNTRIFTLLIAFLAIAGNAVWGQETTKPSDMNGDGTTTAPYELNSKEDLEWFRDYVNEGNPGACAILTDNIELDSSEEWEPIGYVTTSGYFPTYSYTGTFNGDNNTISGINITTNTYKGIVGLFSVIGTYSIFPSSQKEGGKVENLKVYGSITYNNNTASVNAAGICGFNIGEIVNCENHISISGTLTAGGICYQNYGVIKDCANSAAISSVGFSGGICCHNGGEIEKCYNEGAISAKAENNKQPIAAGISAKSIDGKNATIKNCFNSGAITSDYEASGICSISDFSSITTIENCHNFAIISGQDEHIAGICFATSESGNINPIDYINIKNCYYKDCIISGFYFDDHSSGKGSYDVVGSVESKTEVEFADGTVLYLLQSGNPGDDKVWEQTIGTDKYPVFDASSTPSIVYQVTVQPNDATMGTTTGGGIFQAGTEITATATPNEGYEFINWTIGEEEQSTEATYIFNVIESITLIANFQKIDEGGEEEPGDDQDTDKPGTIVKPIKYYNIYIDTICPGLNVEVSKDVVQEGHQVSAYLTIQAECDTTGMRFEYKRSLFGYWQDLKALEGVQPGEYIIKNIYTDIYIRALDATLPEEEPTGIEDVEGVKAYTKEGSIYVYTPNREEVTIISMSGAIIKHAEQVGLQSYSVNRGIYIVRIGEKVFKLKN